MKLLKIDRDRYIDVTIDKLVNSLSMDVTWFVKSLDVPGRITLAWRAQRKKKKKKA